MFEISLAQWSLRKPLTSGQITNLDFPKYTKDTFGISAVEFVNFYFQDKAHDRAYLAELHQRCQDNRVNPLLIMCSREGRLAASDPAERQQSVDNHKRWVAAAWSLGCHSIRVDAHGDGSRFDMTWQMAESLRALCEFAEPYGVQIIIENHGGISSDASWVVEVIKACDHPLAGTLPDFGNFVIDEEAGTTYDPYQGVDELMPYAQGVSAKCYAFGPDGQETSLDFDRLLKIVYGRGFHGYVGIEWGGNQDAYVEGILACYKLLDNIRGRLGT